MALDLSDFMTDHRVLILIDIVGYSKLPDEHQLFVIQEVTNTTRSFIEKGGYKKEKLFSGFIPTGDGFYLIGDTYQSLFWRNTCLVFSLVLRNVLVDSLSTHEIEFEGIRTAFHFGKTYSFKDITDKENYCGTSMNIPSRLLSPINKEEVEQRALEFYGHPNYVT